jgi:hypothetical protein
MFQSGIQVYTQTDGQTDREREREKESRFNGVCLPHLL